MELPSSDISGISHRLTQVLDQIAYARDGADQTQNAGDIGQLPVLCNQLIDVMARAESDNKLQTQASGGPSQNTPVTELGEYALATLARMQEITAPLETVQSDLLTELVVSIALWVARQKGEIINLEPVVDALAEFANYSNENEQLAQLTVIMEEIIDATASSHKQHLEIMDPGHPWRILNLNYGIVATRSHDPALMEHAFNRLTEHLPQEAAAFFDEGMLQMDVVGYPENVRAVMKKYYDTWTIKPILH